MMRPNISLRSDLVEVSINKDRLDRQFIHARLQESYWAAQRSTKEIDKSIECSRCYGLYINGKQLGFARVLTDFVVFGYVMDVIIAPEAQGQGLGTHLMNYILQDPELKGIELWNLRTKDAHGLYEKFGFRCTDQSSMIMDKRMNPY